MEQQLSTLDAAQATTHLEKSKPVRNGTIWRISAIARNAFREAVRDRVLYNLVLFVLLLTAASIFIGELSGGQERKIIVDLGLSAMLLFGMFISRSEERRVGKEGSTRLWAREGDVAEAR